MYRHTVQRMTTDTDLLTEMLSLFTQLSIVMESYAFGTVVLLVMIVGSLYFLYYRKNGRRTSPRRPPSFPSLPFVGSLPFIAAGGNRLYHYFMEKSSELGDVYTFNAGKK